MLGRRFHGLEGICKSDGRRGFYLWDWKHGILDSLCGVLFCTCMLDIVLDDTFIVYCL
jgi:hypothetical protein